MKKNGFRRIDFIKFDSFSSDKSGNLNLQDLETKNEILPNNHSYKKSLFMYIIPAIITMIIMLLVYFFKGIYPFGALTVVYGDMDQHYIPFCYHLHDVIFKGKSFFWDPNLGAGSNFWGVFALSGLFSPVSWLIVFCKRADIPLFASNLLMVRMILMTYTSMLFFRKALPKTPDFWKISLSLMYAFCGYLLIFYTNVAWIDCAILFPLLLIAYKNLLSKNKIAGFIICLSANLIISFYISFMLILFIFFSSGVIIYLYISKGHRREIVTSLTIGTLTSLLLTSFVTVPAFIQSTSSIRYGKVAYMSILNQGIDIDLTMNKAAFFFFSATMLVTFIKMLAGVRKNQKDIIAFILLLILTTSQVIFEAVNLLWYGGSYVCYPLRYGFIPIFLMLAGSAYYFGYLSQQKQLRELSNDSATETVYKPASVSVTKTVNEPFSVSSASTASSLKTKQNSSRKKYKEIIFQAFLAITSLAIVAFALYSSFKFGDKINKTLHGWWGIPANLSLLFFLTTLLFALAIILLLKLNDNKMKYVLISAVLLSEIIMHSFWYVGVPPRGGYLDDWVFTANNVYKSVNGDSNINGIDISDSTDNLKSNDLSRYKDATSVMNSNYPSVIGKMALSSYIHMIEKRQQDSHIKMGYSSDYTRLLDTGGTLLSDMILKVDNFMTSSEYPSYLFTEKEISSPFRLFENKYKLPFGILFSPKQNGLNKDVNLFELPDTTDPFMAQNFMAKTLFGTGENLLKGLYTQAFYNNLEEHPINGNYAKGINYKITNKGLDGFIEYNFSIDELSAVYFYAKDVSKNIRIMVNNEFIKIPTLGNINNYSYPASFNNGIVSLGFFDKKTLNVKIYFKEETNIKAMHFASLSLSYLKNLSEIQNQAMALTQNANDNYPNNTTTNNTASNNTSSNNASSNRNTSNNNVSDINNSSNFNKSENNVSKNNSISDKKLNIDIVKNKIKITLKQISEDQSLFLPINYDKGWECKIDGKKVLVNKIFGTYIQIDIPKGASKVEMVFLPFGIKITFIVSLVTLLLFLFGLYMTKRKKMILPVLIQTITYNVYCITYIAGILMFYIAPIIYFFVMRIRSILP